MDEEPPLFHIVKDKNRLQEEIEDDSTVVKEKKGLIILHDKLAEPEDELRLTNYKTNKPDLELFANQLIQLRKTIREKAKLMEDQLHGDGPEELEDRPHYQIKPNRKFEDRKQKGPKPK